MLFERLSPLPGIRISRGKLRPVYALMVLTGVVAVRKERMKERKTERKKERKKKKKKKKRKRKRKKEEGEEEEAEKKEAG